mgnify:CR=1 FL=1
MADKSRVSMSLTPITQEKLNRLKTYERESKGNKISKSTLIDNLVAKAYKECFGADTEELIETAYKNWKPNY